jgi:nucleotide-binding universal stress UspA family protein
LFSKILVPVDASKHSYEALSAALKLSKSIGSEVTVIHIMEYVPKIYIQSQKQFDELLEAQNNYGKKVLNKCLTQAKEAGTTIKTQLQEGDPATVILEGTSAGKYDLIIMGSRGLGKFKKLLLGSVSSKVVNHATCSVLLIRE